MCRKDACMHGSRPTSSECGSRDGNKLQPCASKAHFCSLEHVLGASWRRPQSSGGGLRKPPPLRSCRPPCPRSPGTVGAAADGPRRARRLLQFLLPRRSSRTRASSVWEQLLASGASLRCRCLRSAARMLCRAHDSSGVASAACLQWHSARVVATHVPHSRSRVVSSWCRAGMLCSSQHVY